jgi:hypothetical protein
MDNGHPTDTPLLPHIHLSKSDCPETPVKKAVKTYQQLIGLLMYIVYGTSQTLSTQLTPVLSSCPTQGQHTFTQLSTSLDTPRAPAW